MNNNNNHPDIPHEPDWVRAAQEDPSAQVTDEDYRGIDVIFELPDGFALDIIETRRLRPRGGPGETNRVHFSATITTEVEARWREDFVGVMMRVGSKKGGGISSTLVEIALKLLMGLLANYKVGEVAEDIRTIVPDKYSLRQIAGNARRFADELEGEIDDRITE